MRRAWALWILAATGCGPSFPPVSIVSQLRVLAVRSDPPEIRPGDSTTLTMEYADPKGGGREVSIAWAHCTPPGLVTDILSCKDPHNLVPLGSGPSITVTAPADYLATDPHGSSDKRFYYVVFVVSAGTEQVTGFKEISVTSQSRALNQNPILNSVNVVAGVGSGMLDGGMPIHEVSVGGAVSLHADFDPASHEQYTNTDGQTVTEVLGFSWFATDGTWDSSRTFDVADNTWTAPLAPQTVQFWVVLRDDRDGTDWKTFTLVVR
jgi:hypothetical protein